MELTKEQRLAVVRATVDQAKQMIDPCPDPWFRALREAGLEIPPGACWPVQQACEAVLDEMLALYEREG